MSSHFAFSPSSPQTVQPAEMERGEGKSRDSRGWGGSDPLVKAAMLDTSEGTVPIVTQENGAPPGACRAEPMWLRWWSWPLFKEKWCILG